MRFTRAAAPQAAHICGKARSVDCNALRHGREREIGRLMLWPPLTTALVLHPRGWRCGRTADRGGNAARASTMSVHAAGSCELTLRAFLPMA